MNRPDHARWNTVKTSAEIVDPVGERDGRLASHHRFVDLDVPASGRDEIVDLRVERVGKLRAERAFVVIVSVHRAVDDRHRPRQRDLDGTCGQRLSDLEVPAEWRRVVADVATNDGEQRLGCASHRMAFELIEIKP